MTDLLALLLSFLNSVSENSAMLLWALFVLAGIAVIGICLKLRRSSYFDSPAFQQAHWEEAHEREKITQQRQL